MDIIALTRSMLETSVPRWAAIARIDDTLLRRPPAPGEWSAVQALQHVVDTEAAVFHARVIAILGGHDFEAFDPDAQGSVGTSAPAPVLVDELAALRAASLETLASVRLEHLELTAVHAELGRVTMTELLHEWAAHDTMHIVQAERALMQAFVPGSGPWRPYFADHDVEVGARER